MASIVLENASVEFKFREAYRISIKEALLRRLSGKPSQPRKMVAALSNINLRLEPGERLGIVGHNGAGKSTLLRLLAGIYVPTSGKRIVTGRISSMLDIGVGIEPDASGWENIEFRGYLQRQSPAALKQKIPEIAEFSELGHFLSMPVRCYSSGMQVRLAFAIATAIDPEILIIDEVFSAGDASFQQKATQRMLNLMAKAKIMVMASHDMQTLGKLCDTAIWLERGQVRMQGPARQVTRAYEEYMCGLANAKAA